MTAAYTRPGSTDVDYNAVTGDSVTGAAQKLDNAIDDLYTQIIDATTGAKGVVQLGTGATNAAQGNHAHTGVYQPVDATLTAIAGVTVAADEVIYATGADAFSTTSLTAAGRAILDDADAAAQRTTLGLGDAATATIGVGVQAYDADTMKSDVVTARTRAHRFTPVAVTAAGGGALSIDCDLHEACSITLAETTTTVGEATNQAADKYVVIQITGATGKGLAWNTNWQKDGAACVIDAPANGVVDLHCFRSSGTEMVHIGSKLAV